MQNLQDCDLCLHLRKKYAVMLIRQLSNPLRFSPKGAFVDALRLGVPVAMAVHLAQRLMIVISCLVLEKYPANLLQVETGAPRCHAVLLAEG